MAYFDPDEFDSGDIFGDRTDEQIYHDLSEKYMDMDDIWEEFYSMYGDDAAGYFWEWWEEFESWYSDQ